MKISRALQSSLLGRIRHILRTATDYARWWARFVLVELLIVSIVVLPSVPARGGFPNGNGDFTIWAEAGRATHSFAIHEASSVNSPNHFYSGTLLAPGGAKVVGNYAGAPNGMVLRDLTTNEIAPLPDEGSDSDIIIPPGAWTNPGDPAAPRTLYIAVPYERSSHQFVVQQGGTSYVATMNSSIQSVWDDVFGQWASEMICTGSALFDPNQSFRIVDLSTNEQFTEGQTFALSNGWEPIPVPPPVHTVNILVDASEVGNTFTVHSMSAGGSASQ